MNEKGIEAEEFTMLEFATQTDKEFEEEILSGYSAMMSTIYRKYTNFTQDEVRIKTLNILHKHILQRLSESLQAKDKKVLKLKQIKEIVKE